MAAPKKEIYISAELEWAEEKLQEWKDYYDSHPYGELKDRLSFKETKNGGMIPMVVASIEQQQKALRDTLKEYFLLLETVNRMREVEEKKKVESRGNKSISTLAEDFLNKNA